jgi:hypothetical protein
MNELRDFFGQNKDVPDEDVSFQFHTVSTHSKDNTKIIFNIFFSGTCNHLSIVTRNEVYKTSLSRVMRMSLVGAEAAIQLFNEFEEMYHPIARKVIIADLLHLAEKMTAILCSKRL